MKLRNLLIIAVTAMAGQISAQTTVAHYDMSLTAKGEITNQLSSGSQTYPVNSELAPLTLTGINGKALRLDGYSTYVKAGLPIESMSTSALTISVTLAAETYPMMKVDVAEDTPTFGTICGNLDEEGKKGFAFELSSQGDLQFRYASSTGFLMTVSGDTKLPRGQWNTLTATLDEGNNVAILYLNGQQIGTSKMSRAGIVHGQADAFYIGKSAVDVKSGSFLINTFCGLIDDITVYNEVTIPAAFTPSTANFNYPSERYTENIWRPQFHGMPSGSWTNECHGMIYSDGKYHVFFQKNANGPYMSRLHWGHISSSDLCTWTEEPIAIYPGESYDIKGCWSGCVYEDDGHTYILYTAVDNAKATIVQAKAKDKSLIDWEKQGIIINGKPSGLSDDFRDPYFFTANNQKYIIVGTSKNNIGACTLHKYENGSWTNDGTIFFQGTSATQHGSFWEMPNVTELGNGKWLFTCTPLKTSVGVRTLCWIGTIGADGKFTPDGNGPQYLEMGGISRDGFGLLSPTIYQKDGKTILLGIVPDILSSEQNYKMGWAHNYSLPREITIDADGTLCQKPYTGLSDLREKTSYEKSLTLTGSQSLSPVNGRQLELLADFTTASGTCGFNFLKSGNKQASLTYDTDKGTLTLDITNLDRTVNDKNTYKGIYAAELPKKVAAGGKLKLHVFLDGSIADIFVNDTWAYSVRIFPNSEAQTEAEVFASTEMKVDVKAWTLKGNGSGSTDINNINAEPQKDNIIYNLQGYCQQSVPKGVYIKNGKKYASR